MAGQTPNTARIRHLKVRNFRALQNVEFKDLTGITVLLGANGSGKSTFFDVFAFLSDCFTDGLRKAVDKRGRFSDLRSRGQTGPIEFEIAYTDPVAGRLIRYHLEIDDPHGKPIVAIEWMHWKRGSYGAPFKFLDYAKGQGQVITGDVPEPDEQRVERPLAGPDILAVSTLGQLAENPRVKSLRDFIGGWHLSYLSANDARLIPEAGPQEHLSKTGNNLANVIQFISENHPHILSKIFNKLQNRIPNLESVNPIPLPSGHLLLELKDTPFKDGIQARYASDGTLKMLAYLVQLYDPNPPPFLGIEEPENFLHPRLLLELAEECIAASSRTQMVITTHSPFFVDGFKPQQVWALKRDDQGYTTATQISAIPEVICQLEQGASLGQLWTEGFIQQGNPW